MQFRKACKDHHAGADGEQRHRSDVRYYVDADDARRAAQNANHYSNDAYHVARDTDEPIHLAILPFVDAYAITGCPKSGNRFAGQEL
jgi:hypothetical protein